MATKTVVSLVDDLTGEGDDVAKVAFGLDGVTYEIDLTEKNAAALRDAFADYVAHGRRTGGRTHRRTHRATSAARATVTSVTAARPASTPPANTADKRKESTEIREWAREYGISVADRGRIPSEVRKRYFDAMKRSSGAA